MKSALAFLILILSSFSALRCGATVYHSDGSAVNVQYIHNTQAGDGDTITVPAGTFPWTTGVRISKAITLQGAGVGQTIVRDGVQSSQLINWQLSPNGVARITGIEFQDGGRVNVGAAPSGIIHITGSNTNGSQFRFDHNKWVNLNGYFVTDTVIGVIDHNTILVGQKVIEWIYPYGNRWNGGSHGDGSWAAPANWGSSQFLFLEDNVITNSNSVYEGQLTDGFNGGRFVVRHNMITNQAIGNHGTETPGRGRSGRAEEIYNNTFDCNHVNRFVSGNRGGGVLFHDNTIVNCGGAGAANPTLSSFRMLGSFSPWGGADGTNGWDKNNIGNPFYSGTLTGVSGNTVTINGAGWTPNQWQGYTLKRNAGGFSYIQNNTSNTITFANDIFGNHPPYAIGNVIVINKVDQSLDQAGAGQSTLISGDNPTPPPGFNQIAEPCYIWNNTNDGSPFNNFDPETANIQQGIHYFNNTIPTGYTPYTYPHPLVTGGPTPTPTPAPTPGGPRTDFNGDGKPDYVLYNAGTQQTAVWYLNNNLYIGGAFTPTLPAGWIVVSAADFNRDGHPDYALFRPSTRQTVIWYFSGVTRIGSTYGPTPPGGWALVATGGDFNNDGKPDYVLYNASTRQTVVWYLNNNVHIGGAYGPTLPAGWSVVGVADFNRDGKSDYLLFNPSTRQTAIFYLSGTTWIGTASGPTPPVGWSLVGVADFNRDGKPDYLLFNASTRQTVIWYMNNNVRIGGAYGPTLPAGWTVAAP